MATAPDPKAWLTSPLRVMQETDREVIRLLQAARDDINRMLRDLARRDGVGAAIRREQLLLAKREIIRRQAELWRDLGDLVRARRLEAAARSLDVGRQLDAYLLGKVGGLKDGAQIAANIYQAEVDAARGAVDRMIARVQGDSYTPLSQRVYNSSVNFGSQIQTQINSALARGLSAREFATQISGFVNPYTPGGVRYAAMRLARTEINNAAHAVTIAAQQDKPWVTAMKWHLSGSHPKVDICNSLASGGPNNDGVYPKSEVPGKPHPHCFCFVTPEVVDPETFLDTLVSGGYDDYLARYTNLGSTPVITKLG